MLDQENLTPAPDGQAGENTDRIRSESLPGDIQPEQTTYDQNAGEVKAFEETVEPAGTGGVHNDDSGFEHSPANTAEPEVHTAGGTSPDSGEEATKKRKKPRTPKKLPEEPKIPDEDIINFSLLSRSDLVKILQELIDKKPVNEIKNDVDQVRFYFYKKLKSELDEKKKQFVEEGGIQEEFQPEEDSDEVLLKELLKKYRELRLAQNKLHEDEKEINYKLKKEIIDEIKELVHRDESINKTFQDFRDLQKRWHEAGIVPQQHVKELWDNYHYHVEKFYDYIKINKELRDLDLKKNLEQKTGLCEKAEALLLEPNVVNAFQVLQTLHDQWREIGPVPADKRTEIWDRFREATAKINKAHQSFYQDLRDTQKKNLDAKNLLCEKAEEISASLPAEHSGWVKKTNEILELQKVWKTIGFAPKKDNNRIYARFRTACDRFFEMKREYYAHTMEDQTKNLQMKIDLCLAAEALASSTDWKNSTEELIRLQKKWKTIGPAPRKQSDEVWKRFRTACDNFFSRKSAFFSTIDSSYENNLKLKEELIAEIDAFTPVPDLKENLARLNDYQRRFAEIGFVPLAKKEEVLQKFRDALNRHFDKLEMDDHRKNMLKFRNKLEDMLQKPKAGIKLRFEREKLMTRLQQLKTDIGVWENNIGFFADTKNAEVMIRDFQEKIKSAHEKIKLLEDKIIAIDEMDAE
jgi:hypothetical protein